MRARCLLGTQCYRYFLREMKGPLLLKGLFLLPLTPRKESVQNFSSLGGPQLSGSEDLSKLPIFFGFVFVFPNSLLRGQVGEQSMVGSRN